MTRYVLAFLLISFCASMQAQKIVLKTDFDGNITEGSIEQLIQKIQVGHDVRVGWHLDFDEDKQSDLEHWVDADFISILNGHVFTQISPIYAQIPNPEIPQIEILESTKRWTAVIGTNGLLLSRYLINDVYNVEDKNIQKYLVDAATIKERRVATVWVVK